MKIKEISVIGLHGCFNYNNVKFNDDVTFLHGRNGSGKTTILNILESIISGQLYKLFNYDFSEISLEYSHKGKQTESIIINSNLKDIRIFFNGLIYYMSEMNYMEDRYNHSLSTGELIRTDGLDLHTIYFKEFPFLEDIRKLFNHVYLPLNRSVNEDPYYFDSKFYSVKDVYYTKYNKRMVRHNDILMKEVETLFRKTHNEILHSIRVVDEKFRKDILKPLTEIQYDFSFQTIKHLILTQSKDQEITKPIIEQTKLTYLKVMSDLQLNNESTVDGIEKFFSTLNLDIRPVDNRIAMQEILQYREFLRVKKIVELADQSEEEKYNLMAPIRLFLDTINSFFVNSDNDKKVISMDGEIKFVTEYSNQPLSIALMSSGEKQILSFFANLIFKIKQNSGGIYIVDEPELSLHLSWQSLFVDRALRVNKDIQFVFATHSPEIVGHRYNKTSKLIKQYVKMEHLYER